MNYKERNGAKSARQKIITFLQVVLLLFFCINNQVTAQLRQIHVETAENHIYNGSLYTASEGYVSFLKSVGYTTDTGRTIIQKPINLTNVNFNNYTVNLTFGFEVTGIKAFNKNNIIVYGDYGLVPAILYSSDAGNTFKLVFHSQFSVIPGSWITDMIFPSNGLIGYATDADRILKTVDGGVTWTVSNTLAGAHYTKLQALSDNVIYAFSSYGTTALYSTTNGGGSWTTLTLPPTKITSVYFLSQTKGWATDLENFVYITTNGITWAKQNDNLISPFQATRMQFVNDSTGYALNGTFQIYKTTNSGKIWERLPRDNNYSYLGYGFNDIQISGSTIWAGGGHGFLELSTNSGGAPIPKALFKYDTTGLAATGKIKLLNYSRTGYSYSWLVNGKPVATTYNGSYPADIYAPNDTIKLICSNNGYADTATAITNINKSIQIDSFTPTTGITGTTISINGTNFENITEVSFGGVPAKSFKVNNATNISAVIAAGASGNVTVKSAKSRASKSGFTYIPPPTITSISPIAAPVGATVTITGTGFTDVTRVLLDNYSWVYKVISPTQITATVGDISSGSITVTAAGGSVTMAGFHLLPTITSIDKTSGTFGTSITIYGNGLGEVNAVTLDGNPVRSFNRNAVGIYAIIGDGSAGNFTVSTPYGSSTYAGFTYYQTAKIKSFSPTSGPIGTMVTIKGSNFDKLPAGNIVFFGIERAVVSAATDSTLTVNVPLGANYKPINVIAHGTSCYSSIPFAVTFNNTTSLNAAYFSSKITLQTGMTQRAVLADIDNNGSPDIIVTTIGSAGTIARIMLNNSKPGNISLSTSIMQYGGGGSSSDYHLNGSLDVNTADWNMDGKLDLLLVGIFGGNAAVNVPSFSMFNNGYGYASYSSSLITSFGEANRQANYNVPNNIEVGDIDGDGKTDYLVGRPYFTFPNVLLADVDSDGKPDVLVKSASNLLVYRNISTRGNIVYDTPLTFDMGGLINEVFSGDFDNDGKLEIAVAMGASTAGTVKILKNTGTQGSINLAVIQNITTGGAPIAGCAADFDGDGKLDMAIINGSNISVFKNTASGLNVAFGAAIDIPQDSMTQVIAGDLDADSRPDLVCVSRYGGDGIIILNKLKNLAGITSFTPGEGFKGTTISLTGAGLTGTTAVTIGGTTVQSFVVNTDSTMTITAGSGVTGYINVIKPTSTLISLTPFIFTQPPVITSISNTTGITGSGLTLTGTNFTGATKVSFGGVDATTFQVVSPNTINATVGAGASGIISVTTPAGTGTLAGFVFLPVPIVTVVGSDVLLTGSYVTLSTPIVAGCTYQWKQNGTIIYGATSATFNAYYAGVYTVSVNYNNGISQTSAGVTINAIFTLPASNFRISSTSVTCKGSSNGAINISAAQNLGYTATITGKGLNSVIPFTTTTALNNLSAGTYNICVTVAGQPNYQQCFTVIVTEPKDLSAYSTINIGNNTVSLALSGGGIYNVQLNGVLHTTTDSVLTLSLKAGRNTLMITTDKPCQGIIDKTITASEDVLPYPNPADKILYINLGNQQVRTAKVAIYSAMGALVYKNQFDNPGNTVRLDVSTIPMTGVYTLILTTDNLQKTFSIIKR
ncbi:IPT/TIG domain-containing protein [Mucilaginibacter paludis]|nr:IPT/TIG domain-containing protein [Mucilaginibacter paludis]